MPVHNALVKAEYFKKVHEINKLKWKENLSTREAVERVGGISIPKYDYWKGKIKPTSRSVQKKTSERLVSLVSTEKEEERISVVMLSGPSQSIERITQSLSSILRG